MIRRLQQVPRQETPPPEVAEAEPAQEVPYRPPLEQLTSRPALIFVCRDAGVVYIDTDAMKGQVAGHIRDRKPDTADTARLPVKLPDAGIRAELVLTGEKATPSFLAQIVLTFAPGVKSWSQADLPATGSPFAGVIGRRNGKTHDVMFFVWPDSYEIFHRGRSIAWQSDFDVGWKPLDSGEPLVLTLASQNLGVTY
jgi:hypothetical protein